MSFRTGRVCRDGIAGRSSIGPPPSALREFSALAAVTRRFSCQPAEPVAQSCANGLLRLGSFPLRNYCCNGTLPSLRRIVRTLRSGARWSFPYAGGDDPAVHDRRGNTGWLSRRPHALVCIHERGVACSCACCPTTQPAHPLRQHATAPRSHTPHVRARDAMNVPRPSPSPRRVYAAC